VRTPHSERFVLTNPKTSQDLGALELHFLTDGTVAASLILFEAANVTEDQVPELLKRIDEELLPKASLEERNLSFTVVVGKVLGNFVPEQRGD